MGFALEQTSRFFDSLIDRVVALVTRPNARTWTELAEETPDRRQVLLGFLLPLMLLCSLPLYVVQARENLPYATLSLLIWLCGILGACLIMAPLTDMVASALGAPKRGQGAFGLFSYVYTGMIVGKGIAILLLLLGVVGLVALAHLAGLLLSLYLLFLGASAFYPLGGARRTVLFFVVCISWFLVWLLLLLGVQQEAYAMGTRVLDHYGVSSPLEPPDSSLEAISQPDPDETP